MLAFKYEVKLNSEIELNDLKQRIIFILTKRKYKIIRETYNTVAFDNGIFSRKTWSFKVNQGEFFLIEEDRLVIVNFNYEISYFTCLLGFLGSIFFGVFVSPNFFYLSGISIIFWPIQYFILKSKAEELITVCKAKTSGDYSS
jgi:hypothetical protein